MPQMNKVTIKKAINQEILNNKLKDNIEYKQELGNSILKVSKYFNTPIILKELKKSKIKGFLGKDLFYSLILSVFYQINSIFALTRTKYFLNKKDDNQERINSKKDSYYRFCKNDKNNWRKISNLYLKQFYEILKMESLKSNKSTKSTLPTCFIVDDSILPKTGKTIGGLFEKDKSFMLNMTIVQRVISLLFDIINFIFGEFGFNCEDIDNFYKSILQDEIKYQKFIRILEFNKNN